MAQLLPFLRQLTQRGAVAAERDPARRRLLLFQIDGLSSRRLERALAGGEMPRLGAALASQRFAMRRITSAGAPSTPVHQASILYGTSAGIPGFGWRDRALDRTVRMDLAEDASAIEHDLRARGGPGLLDGGMSYGTIFTGGALDTFFNVVQFGGQAPTLHGNLADRAASLATLLHIATRVSSRLATEISVGVSDFIHFVRHQRTTRFEWRFLLMRLFVSVVLRDATTHGAALDVLRGVPLLYLDYFGYDEYAHRRGPDSRLALFNLRGIDEALGHLLDTIATVPEYGYELFVLSDHGQSATTPFERLIGQELGEFVLRHAMGPVHVHALAAKTIRDLVKIRALRFWARTQPAPLRALLTPVAAWLQLRTEARLRQAAAPDANGSAGADHIEVVTGGSVAHIYFDHRREPMRIEAIETAWPVLLRALADCPAVGMIVARGASGPVLVYRGQRYSLGDRRLAALPPFRALGYPLLAHHLRSAVRSPRSGDLVLFGAFAEAGNVAFDFEFGSHGGIHPDELDSFLIHPQNVGLPSGNLQPHQLYHYFRRRYRARL